MNTAAAFPAVPLAHGPALRLPRLGFAGVGWIGRHRLEALMKSRTARVCAIADPDRDNVRAAARLVEEARIGSSFEDLLDEDLDGIVIATPSALHAGQAQRALERGVAVFCQKPLSRTAGEAASIVRAAHHHDRLLGVDLSYRHVAGVAEMRDIVLGGGIGELFAADLAFHNAYGPDKSWVRDARLSGGGCLIDLGTHLVDLVLWMLDFPAASCTRCRLYAHGQPLEHGPAGCVEDFAVADWLLAGRTSVRLACSWNVSAGKDAHIEATFYGSRGAVRLRNAGGSFYDFFVEQMTGTCRRTIAGPPDAWGGRAILDWAQRLRVSPRFDDDAFHFLDTAALIDALYRQ